MAYFQLSRDVPKWFADIETHYPTKFDLYYLCAIAGLKAERKSEPVNATDLVENFPLQFKPTGHLLVGLLLSTELRLAGVDLKERLQVHRIIGELVDPSSPSSLRDEGLKVLNRYAQGGFDKLCEEFADRPRTVETFIRKYSDLIA
jgi:hypothetical protein